MRHTTALHVESFLLQAPEVHNLRRISCDWRLSCDKKAFKLAEVKGQNKQITEAFYFSTFTLLTLPMVINLGSSTMLEKPTYICTYLHHLITVLAGNKNYYPVAQCLHL